MWSFFPPKRLPLVCLIAALLLGAGMAGAIGQAKGRVGASPSAATTQGKEALVLNRPFELPRLHRHHLADTTHPASRPNHFHVNPWHVDPKQWLDTLWVLVDNPFWNDPFTMPVAGGLTSGFGPRDLMGHTYHYGVDLALNTGDTVVAVQAGVVRAVGNDPAGYGHYVVLSHPNGLETLYGHLSAPLVQVSDRLTSGQPLGLGGNTGASTGPHLHFEYRFLGAPIDPAKVIDLQAGQVRQHLIALTPSWFQYPQAQHSHKDAGHENHQHSSAAQQPQTTEGGVGGGAD